MGSSVSTVGHAHTLHRAEAHTLNEHSWKFSGNATGYGKRLTVDL